MEELAYELNLAAAHARARRRGRMAEARPLAAALRRRRDRPDHQDRVDLARRQRPGLPQHQLRCAGRRLRRRAARPDRRRRRPGPGRNHLRHAQRQGGAVRDRERVRAARRAPAADHLRHHHRRLGPHAVGPDHRGVLQLGAPCEPGRGGPELRAGREGTAAVRRGALRHRRGAGLLLPERGPAERVRRIRRHAGIDGEGNGLLGARRGS